MAEIKIHGVPPSTFTRAVRLACREKGIDYELVPTRPGETAPINPLGKIPMMKHGDFTLYESTAIAPLCRPHLRRTAAMARGRQGRGALRPVAERGLRFDGPDRPGRRSSPRASASFPAPRRASRPH